ncbi:MAG TPA: RluA family pseudouridine synthase [Terriglobales bacterium]|nr:RluA family pseudouridine synthase [Terriglobales bacterium]
MSEDQDRDEAPGARTPPDPSTVPVGKTTETKATAVRVLFENDELLAVDKPEGVVSISGAGAGGLPELLRREGVYAGRLYPVHRLDRGASGVIVYAKTPEMHRYLNGEFDRRAVRKTYLALVHGLTANRGVVNKPLREFGSGRMGVDEARGKPSSTEFKVERRLRGFTLLRVRPLTGRRHQIRVHLYSLGHPIVGDSRYGERALQERYPRLMLHALEIEFALPTGERLKIAAPLPESFRILGSDLSI